MIDPDLARLADAARVSTGFTDWRGVARETPEASVRAVLAAMGIDASDPAAALAALWDAPWRRMLPPFTVAVRGRARWLWVHVPDGAPAALEVRLEGGGARPLVQVDHWVAPREVDGARIGEATFLVPDDLPLGYHRLVASSGATSDEAVLMVTPERIGLPTGLARGWGVAAQLYSVRSAESWGVGDLADLADLAVWAGADRGADFVLVNPLHAAEPAAPLEPSPYLPSSRRFANPLSVRVERVPEYAQLAAVDRRRIATLRDRLRNRLAAAGGDAIDRDAAWTAKRAALKIVARAPRSAGRELDLRAYRERRGEALVRFARWSAIALEHGSDSRTWPHVLRDPGSAAVAAFAAEHADEVDFACWLQWVTEEQLGAAQGRAVDAGMRIGVLQDLAVGVHPGGADAWSDAGAYAPGITVGAPPDPFTQLGQDWNQPPWRPDRLAEAAYEPLRAVVAAALRHAGGLRVDHVIGMFRLWWVPAGRPATEGCYVGYDDEAMLGVLALEAHRAGAVLIGEDLGVVEPRAREVLAARGILGTSILWFERGGEGPLPAERWREQCLATVTTHDLPPTAGYLAGDHVLLRDRLGLTTRPLDEELAADAAERAGWLSEVRSRIEVADDADEEALVVALHEYLTLTPARLLGVALTDLVGDRRAQNQPGTKDEYPNWRVPLSGPDGAPLPLEQVFTSARAARLARAVGGR